MSLYPDKTSVRFVSLSGCQLSGYCCAKLLYMPPVDSNARIETSGAIYLIIITIQQSELIFAANSFKTLDPFAIVDIIYLDARTI